MAVTCTMKELVSGIKRITKKSGVLCDSHRCDRMGKEYQPKCTFHFFWACSPRTASGTYYKEREGALTGNGSHQNTNVPSLNCSKHPAFHLCACGGRIPLPSPLFHSWPSFLQGAENLPHQLPSSLFGTVGPSFTTDFFPCCPNTAIPLQLLFP